MANLREIKPRKEGGTHAGDLRGLGNDPLLKEAFPFANLHVSGLAAAQLGAIADQFQLACHPSQHPHSVHLRKKVLQSGEHKGQAVALFAAALMIHQEFPAAHMHLVEVSGLHVHLSAAIKSPRSTQGHDADAIVDFNHKTPLLLSVPVQMHLAQSGVAIHTSDAAAPLSTAQMQQHLDALRQMTAAAAPDAAQHLKKVG